MTNRPSGNHRAPAFGTLFKRTPVLELEELTRALGTSSRTVFRRLSSQGYLSSYSHAGRYYTLAHTPCFDAHGLWSHGEVRFSKHGTLRDTVVVLVQEASDGRTHDELRVILGLKVHDTLLNLVQASLLGRERVEGVYVYTDPDPERAKAQLEQRQRATAPAPEPAAAPSPPPPVDLARLRGILLAVIHGPKDDAATIAARLRLGGIAVEDEQVEVVFAQYGLGKKNGALPLEVLAALRGAIDTLGQKYQAQVHAARGVLVEAEGAEAPPCPRCGVTMHVRKTLRRMGQTLAHGSFLARETEWVCPKGCTREVAGPAGGAPRTVAMTRRSETLAKVLLPRRAVGYDLLAFVGIQRFVRHNQREEIRSLLESSYGITVSTGEVSLLARDFVVYLEVLHKARAPQLKAALDQDGGWPMHIDATGENGRGTLLVVYAGWRRWVLGSWKIPTECADAILPRLHQVADRFGPPCAIMRDLGRAMIEASRDFVTQRKLSIPELACHFHFAKDVGKDLLSASYDELRQVLRRFEVRAKLRALARELGRELGVDIEAARDDLESWLEQDAQGHMLPEGRLGLVTARALVQWTLDYADDGTDAGFPFDLPYLDLFRRCGAALRAVEAFLRNPAGDAKARRTLERLHRIVEPLRSQVPFHRPVAVLEARSRLFTELRGALRLRIKVAGDEPAATLTVGESAEELQDIEKAVEELTKSLRARWPTRGPAQDTRAAIDLILEHLDCHGRSLWGHAIGLPEALGGGMRLVDRTNIILEGFNHEIKHGERRRSGRKTLTQDLEQLPGAALIAANLKKPDYVAILCGELERLGEAFAELDRMDRHLALPLRKRIAADDIRDVVGSSLPTADRDIIRSDGMRTRVLSAAQSRAPRRLPTAGRRAATVD